MLLEIYGPDGGDKLTIEAKPGARLSAAIWLSGQLAPIPLCGGLSLCKRCRVRFLKNAPSPVEADLKAFPKELLESGWRLACRHFVPDSDVLELELPTESFLPAASIASRNSLPETDAYLGIDLGTTSIQWQAKDAAGATLAQASLLNPQAGAGPDVVSRLTFAMRPDGRHLLSGLIRRTLALIIANLANKNLKTIRACIAANSAMTEILLEKDISGLCAAPYQLSFTGDANITLNLSDSCKPLEVYFPPLPAPFVGADISAGLLALLTQSVSAPFILADLGTNAEIALYLPDGQLFLASAPLGPALEGIGPQCGQPAGKGVITSFTLNQSGVAPVLYQADASEPCKGISASGYISLLAILLKLGVMTSAGQLITPPNNPMPLAQKLASGLNSGCLPLPYGQTLNNADIELLLKAKAAFAVAMQCLLAAAKVQPYEIKALYLAGALGQYADLEDLTALGFLAPTLAAKVQLSGNTSLTGACILARDPDKGARLGAICRQAKVLQLGDDPEFISQYLQAMRWGQYAS